jgi:hypothetical protein
MWGAFVDSTYFRDLAARCLVAARRSFDVEAIGEFRKLAEEFARKADAVERLDAPIVIAKRSPAKRERAGNRPAYLPGARSR